MCTTTYTALPPYTTFLYPSGRLYPFDEVCEKIVRALERRNWKVPGIEVRFSDSGSGESKYRHVKTIRGENFRLNFYRCSGFFPRLLPSGHNDTSSVAELTIPKRELHVYVEGGPTYWHYIGSNWETDKDAFTNGYKPHERKPQLPRTYLAYDGASLPLSENPCRCHYAHKSNPYLINATRNNKWGYEDPRENEPQTFETEQVFQEFTDWITSNVLQFIESIEEAKSVELTSEPEIPYPESIGPFYAKVNKATYDRIVNGKEDKSQLKPPQRYALTGNYVQTPFHTPIWSFAMPELTEEEYNTQEGDRSVAVVRITPKRANHIFVADNAPGETYKRQCCERDPTLVRLSDKMFEEYQRCFERTIVPIEKYTGNYEMPVVLVSHFVELSFDEVEIVREKPKKQQTDKEKDLEQSDTRQGESYCVIL